MDRREFNKLVAATVATGSGAANLPSWAATGPSGVKRSHRKEWAKEQFRGFENITMPSFTQDLKQLDEAGIRLDVRKAIEHGFFGTVCALTALSPEETRQFLEIVNDEAAGRIAISMSMHETEHDKIVSLIETAEQAGCDYFLLDFPKTGTQDELYQYVARYAEMTDMGVYLWLSRQHGFERFHPSGIPFELLDRAADLPNLIAVKVASIDAAVFYELFERYGDRLLMGSPLISIIPMACRKYGMQWSGAWAVEAVQSPETPYATEFFELMLDARYDDGMKLYWQHLSPGFAAMRRHLGPNMKGGAHPWEHFKTYQFAVGGNGGRMRTDPEYPDIPPVMAEDLATVKADLARIQVPTTDLPFDAFAAGRVNW